MIFCNLGGFLKRIDDGLSVGLFILPPFFDSELCAVDSNHPVFANAMLFEDASDSACHSNGR